jgi:hypothetical protein
MSNRTRQPKVPPAVSVEEYSGQWIAWDRKQTRILAHGDDFVEVQKAAMAAGEADPLLQKVPIAGTIFIGAWG